ncbi:hypothetical protein MMC28_009317 [Mycoblastus sanguinarius]|nr:hypothetical protein [Mycoblastus sanguinarius]
MSRLSISQEDALPSLEIEDVTPSNKLDLLQNAIEASQSTIEETKQVLARLEKFHSATADLFSLKRRAMSQIRLKLICVSSGIRTDLPRSFSSFIALSYCWHGGDWSPIPAFRRSKDLPLSSIMFRALLRQLKSPDEGIWIDEKCINQRNEEEKMNAIGAMDIIYKSARVVIIALEDIKILKEEEGPLRDLIANPRHSGWLPHQDHLRALSTALIHIFEARWFKRAWCSHELQLGKNHLFLIPTDDGLVELTPDSLEDLYTFTVDYVIGHEDLAESMKNVSLSYDLFDRAHNSISSNRSGRSFISEFADIVKLDCSYMTDKVSISINVASLQLYFKGAIETVHQCRWILSMIALSAGDVTVLGGVDEALNLNVGVDSEAESWLRWSGDLEDSMVMTHGSRLPEHSHITSIDEHQITLDLFIFKNLNPGCIKRPSERSLQAAKLIMEMYFESSDKERWLNKDRTSPDFQKTMRLQIEVVACALDCGVDWILKQIASSELLATELREKERFFDLKQWAIGIGLSQSFPPRLDALTQQALVRFFIFIVHELEKAEGHSQYYSGMYEPRGNDKPRGFTRCVWLDLGTAGKAITSVGASSVEEKVGQVTYAVPVVLGHPNCATIRRLWILERDEEDGPWTLVEKIRFFCLLPIEEDGINVTLGANQVIQGGFPPGLEFESD